MPYLRSVADVTIMCLERREVAHRDVHFDVARIVLAIGADAAYRVAAAASRRGPIVEVQRQRAHAARGRVEAELRP